MSNKYVCCHFCKKPIHVDKLGGVINFGDGVDIWFCTNIVCLVELVLLRSKKDCDSV